MRRIIESELETIESELETIESELEFSSMTPISYFHFLAWIQPDTTPTFDFSKDHKKVTYDECLKVFLS